MNGFDKLEQMELLREIIENESIYIKEQCEKFLQQSELLNRWLYAKNIGFDIGKYCKERGYKKLVIYGMAALGERLLEEIEKTDVVVVYGVDRDPLSVNARNKIKIIGFDEEWEQHIDAVIVTPILYYDELKEIIRTKVSCPILSLKDVVWAL